MLELNTMNGDPPAPVPNENHPQPENNNNNDGNQAPRPRRNMYAFGPVKLQWEDFLSAVDELSQINRYEYRRR